MREKLDEDPEKKEKFISIKAKYMAWVRVYEKWALDHNNGSESDEVSAKISKKETYLPFGKVSRNYLFEFPSIKTLGQDIYYECEPFGKM